jgi:sulfur-oxidizing protein SoxY
MNPSRRTTLQLASGAGLYAALLSIGLLEPGRASAAEFDRAAFNTKGVADTLKALGVAEPAQSADVVITSPDIAENGAVVPVAIRSKLAGTDRLALLVDKNPNGLAAAYDLLPGAAAEVSMRIKMGESSDVVALVRADGKYYMARKEIKVTLGGCGG